MDAFNDNPAAFIFYEVDEAVIHIALHFLWDYSTAIYHQQIKQNNEMKNKNPKWQLCIVLELKAAWQYSLNNSKNNIIYVFLNGRHIQHHI